MNVQELPSGSQIELEIHSGSDTLSLHSSVVKPIQNSILIEKLDHEGKLLGIPDNCSVNLLYVDTKDSCPYVWENVSVRPVRYKEGIYHYIDNISAKSNAHINRRKAFRLYIGKEMILSVHDNTGLKQYRVLLKDISETGMAFVTKEDFPIKKLVHLDFIDNGFSIPLSGHIVRKTAANGSPNKTVYGCHFSSPRPLLNKYIAKKQQQKLHRQRQ